MGRYATSQQTPVQSSIEGDQFYDRVNMKEDRSTLPPGTLALSVNKRLRKKKAECRPGILPPVFANILNLSQVRGWGVYTNPNGEEVLAACGASEVYLFRDGSYPTTIPIQGVLAPSVEFIQAHDKLFIFQDKIKTQLVWDGVNPGGFVKITKTHPEDSSTILIPPAETAEHIADRLLIIKDANNVLATDIADYVSYDPILEVFYVDNDSGSSDAIKRVFAYAKGIAIVFSSRSVGLLLNFSGDPSLASVELLNSQIGLAGRKAVVMLGGDVLFLSEPGGIYRVAQSFESRQQVVPLPVTDPIQPLIDRINWRAAGGAVAALLGEYWYFAVPIDGSTVNNAVIVGNGATGIVEGYDTFNENLQIDDFKVTLYEGERRLFALDKNAARIYLMYEGRSDFVYFVGGDTPDPDRPIEYHINDLMETRGFATLGWNSATRRDFKKVEIGVSTWAPSIMITALTDSVSDERQLNVTPITKSRTEYDTFARPDWDATNVNDDWTTPGRQDYSIELNDTGYDPGSGIDPDRKQTGTLRFSTKARGRWVSYRIANTHGQCDVNTILMESSGSQREPRRGG